MDEWQDLEKFRTEVFTELLGVCRTLHNLRGRLTEGMVQILVENPGREYGVSKDLADCEVALLKAIRGLERKRTMEQVLTNSLGEETWDSQTGTA